MSPTAQSLPINLGAGSSTTVRVKYRPTNPDGAFGAFEWPVQTVKLSPGELIFVFSDGVTEAERGDEQFGDKRTEQLVAGSRQEGSKQIVDRLMGSINEFMGDAPRSDDITIMTVKRAAE